MFVFFSIKSYFNHIRFLKNLLAKIPSKEFENEILFQHS